MAPTPPKFFENKKVSYPLNLSGKLSFSLWKYQHNISYTINKADT
jgi:hypothetical protein